jgi:hypothetical protein
MHRESLQIDGKNSKEWQVRSVFDIGKEKSGAL